MRARLGPLVALLVLASAMGGPIHAGEPSATPGPGGFLRESSNEGEVAAIPAPAPGFTDTVSISGLSAPTAVRFASNGSVLVAEKRGRVLLSPGASRARQRSASSRNR